MSLCSDQWLSSGQFSHCLKVFASCQWPPLTQHGIVWLQVENQNEFTSSKNGMTRRWPSSKKIGMSAPNIYARRTERCTAGQGTGRLQEQWPGLSTAGSPSILWRGPAAGAPQPASTRPWQQKYAIKQNKPKRPWVSKGKKALVNSRTQDNRRTNSLLTAKLVWYVPEPSLLVQWPQLEWQSYGGWNLDFNRLLFVLQEGHMPLFGWLSQLNCYNIGFSRTRDDPTWNELRHWREDRYLRSWCENACRRTQSVEQVRWFPA